MCGTTKSLPRFGEDGFVFSYSQEGLILRDI